MASAVEVMPPHRISLGVFSRLMGDLIDTLRRNAVGTGKIRERFAFGIPRTNARISHACWGGGIEVAIVVVQEEEQVLSDDHAASG